MGKEFVNLLDSEKLRQHVIEQLSPIGKVKGDEIIIRCFSGKHNDNNPSLGVHIGFKVPPGTYHCFSCKAHGSWNSLAKHLNLVQFKHVGESSFKANPDDPFQILSKSLNSKPLLDQEITPKRHGIEPLPGEFEWRGLSREFLVSREAKFWWQRDVKRDFEMDWLYFPLTRNRKYTGYTLCALKPHKPKYMVFGNTLENFFLYDHVAPGGPIVLVEGHFDCLRLQSLGIPSLAIFGVANWGPIKKSLLLAKNPSRVVLLFDGDDAGYEATNLIFEDLRTGFDVKPIFLPKTDEKYDPGNMPVAWVDDLLRVL